jgi:O-antigen ligase
VSPLLVSLRVRPPLITAYQLFALHTFVAAVLQIGLKARGVALSLVCLICVFITLWVAIGAGIHKNYETPTPVRNSPLFFPILSSLLTLLGSVLVLDQPSVPGRTPWWRIHLVVDRIICFGNTIHSTVFLGGGFLVG